MHPKVQRWIKERGRRLAELKIMGAEEYFKPNRDEAKLNQLDGQEWVEFFTLTGQLDALIWAFAPKRNPEQFLKEIQDALAGLEKECRDVYTLTGQTNIIRSKSRWDN